MFTRGRGPFDHRCDELRFAPIADTICRIRGNIRHVKNPKGRSQSEASAKPGLIRLVWNRVTGNTAASIEHFLAVSEIGCMRTECAGRNGFRNREEPEHRQPK